MEVFTASPRDRAPQRIVEQISSFLQLFTVVAEFLVEVFKASPRDRAHQRFMEQITKTLLFLTVVEKVLVVVFTVFLPDISPDSVQRSRTSSQLPVSVPVVHGVLRSRTLTFLFVASRAHGGLQDFSPGQSSSQRTVPGDEDDPPARFGTVLVASGDMRPGVIAADGGQRLRFQLPSWFHIPVGRRVAFHAEEGDCGWYSL